MGSFTDSLQKQINRVLSEVDSKCYGVAYTLFMKTIELTPSDTKYSRGNLVNDWHCAQNSFSSAIFSPPDENGNSQVTANTDPTGSGSISRVLEFKEAKTFYGKNGSLSLSNSQPYVAYAEYLGWPEGQHGTWHWTGTVGPYAMVRNALTYTAAKYK